MMFPHSTAQSSELPPAAILVLGDGSRVVAPLVKRA